MDTYCEEYLVTSEKVSDRTLKVVVDNLRQGLWMHEDAIGYSQEFNIFEVGIMLQIAEELMDKRGLTG
jgi:hypothetical protein